MGNKSSCSCFNVPHGGDLELYTGPLENFQNETVNLGKIRLNRYDRFYRKTSKPLHLLTVRSVFDQLELMLYDVKTSKMKHNIDFVPLETFVNSFVL